MVRPEAGSADVTGSRPIAAVVATGTPRRLLVRQYHKVVRLGNLTDGDAVELPP